MAASPSLHPSGSTPAAAFPPKADPPATGLDAGALDLEALSDLEAAARRLDQIANRTNSGQAEAAITTVDAILAQVRDQGDQALLDLSERFDGVRPDPLRISAEQIQAAWNQCDSALKAASVPGRNRHSVWTVLPAGMNSLPNTYSALPVGVDASELARPAGASVGGCMESLMSAVQRRSVKLYCQSECSSASGLACCPDGLPWPPKMKSELALRATDPAGACRPHGHGEVCGVNTHWFAAV